MNALKESVVVSRTALTQMGATTVHAIIATSLQVTIMGALVNSNIGSLYLVQAFQLHNRQL